MKYIVLEMQTANDGTVAVLSYQFDDKDAAESKYHYILSYAAVSSLPCASAVLLNDKGELYASQYYEHPQG